MTAATFHIRTEVPEARSGRKPGFWMRLFEGMAEARLHAAIRELERHRHLVPEDVLKTYGYTATLDDDSRLPFTR